jgi:hypothetical protein
MQLSGDDKTNCNYLKDNRKKIEANKNDVTCTAFFGVEYIPVFSCETGTSEYEPTEEERLKYCIADFVHCPRLHVKLFKK